MSLNDTSIDDALLCIAGLSIDIDSQTLGSIWTENQETVLKEVFDGQPYINRIATATKLWDSILRLTTAESVMLEQVICWVIADPVIVLEAMTQGVVSVVDMRASSLPDCQLQDFATQYLHEYLNCSPWMDEWRFIAQRLFNDATWEDVAALHIDKIVKDIWRWQFPLGAFEKWVNTVLGILKEDLTQAGTLFREFTNSHSVPSRKQNQCGLGTMWILTSDCAALWDPYVEELAGEFWYMIETTPLALPGSWVFDDEDDGDRSRCLLYPEEEGYKCLCRRQRFYRGNECIDNERLRVRGMMTCRERRPLYFDNGTEF